jgi:hypothetical protein
MGLSGIGPVALRGFRRKRVCARRWQLERCVAWRASMRQCGTHTPAQTQTRARAHAPEYVHTNARRRNHAPAHKHNHSRYYSMDSLRNRNTTHQCSRMHACTHARTRRCGATAWIGGLARCQTYPARAQASPGADVRQSASQSQRRCPRASVCGMSVPRCVVSARCRSAA